MTPFATPIARDEAVFNGWLRACCVALALVLGLLCVRAASAQPHERSEGPYTVRASTLRADELPIEQRDAHHIPPGEDVAVLNVIVQRQGTDGLINERAKVRATWVDLAGRPTTVEMREVTESGFVSYLGIYRFRRDTPLRFDITVLPHGEQRSIELRFVDRLGL